MDTTVVNIPAFGITRFPRFSGSWLWFVLYVVVGLLPVILMLVSGFFRDGTLTLANYRTLFSDPRIISLLLRSCGLGIGAGVLSLIFGLPLALLLKRTRFLGRELAGLVSLVPLFIPPHVHGLAWIYLLGAQGPAQRLFELVTGTAVITFNLNSFFGATVILFLAYYPLLVLTVTTGLSQIDRRLEEAAAFSGGSWRTIKAITLPLITPYLLAGFVFVFIFSIFNYGVPAMLRLPTYPVEIFTHFSAYYDEAGASTLAMPLVLLAGCLLLVQRRYLNDRSCVTIVGGARLHNDIGKKRSLLAAFCVWGFLLGTVFAPILALVIQAGNWQSIQQAWQSSYREFGTSVLVAAGGATCTTVVAYFLASCIAGIRGLRQKLVDISSLLPFGFPAVLFGIGLIHMWNTPYTGLIYTSVAILFLAYMARFIPFGTRIILANLTQISPAMTEAAQLCGASRIRRLWKIELPLARRGLVISWIVVFVFSMGELGATLLVIPPGAGTVSLKIYTLMHYGAGPLVAALALLLIVVNLLVLAAMTLALHLGQHSYERNPR